MFDGTTDALLVVGVMVVCIGYSLHAWAHSKGRKWR